MSIYVSGKETPKLLFVGCQDENCKWNETKHGTCWCRKNIVLIGTDGKCLDREEK